MLIENLNESLDTVLLEVMKHHGYTSNLFESLDKIFPKDWINNSKFQVKVSSIIWYLHVKNPNASTHYILYALGEIIEPILEHGLEVEAFTVTY